MGAHKLDQFHYHEAMDRSHIATDHFHEYVEKHVVVTSNKELKKKAEEVTSLMYEFYNLCSSYIDNDKRAISYYDDG